ncbi:dTDP-4-dehydrorhamnose reductase [Hyunsoonleella ulvae]|uniref:dTDP-4-dehydrorhamnose reductase n=1 Tax=Hyunsoonleella ulvae TaxID=2799948 RepID=UPI001939CBE1|nr:dTDP-4-dehydrorhamnose reductase [Hyunsoonleella ulvae]
MKKKVLVTGANGQLGKTIQELNANNTKGLYFMFVSKSELDITNLDDLKILFNKNSFDYVINCAAYTDVEQAEKTPKISYKVNAEGVKNIAKVCLEHDTVLIHISTDYVFDGNTNSFYSEGDQTCPISVYGASKLQGELNIKNITENYFIIRTSWLYSEYGNNFLKTMLRLASERDKLSVVSDQIGTPTYAKDLAKVILRFIAEKTKIFGTYHYSNDGAVSWFDFANAIFKYSNLEVNLKSISSEELPQEAKRPKFSVLDKKKIQKNLKIEIPSWEDSLKKCLVNIQKSCN